MSVRFSTLGLALLLAVAPAASLICELTCVRPVSAPSLACHDETRSPGSAAIRAEEHQCGQAHPTAPGELRTADTSRVLLIAAATLVLADPGHAILAVSRGHGQLLSHGPPGALPLSAVPFPVLRI